MPYPKPEPELIDVLLIPFEVIVLAFIFVIVWVYNGANYIYKKIVRFVCALKAGLFQKMENGGR